MIFFSFIPFFFFFFFFFSGDDLVSLFHWAFAVHRKLGKRERRAMAPPRPPRPTIWRSKSPAAAIAVAATATLLLLLLLKTSDRASAAITSSSSSSSRTSSAAASVSLHAKWQAAPLVLEAVEFLVRKKDRNHELLDIVDAGEHFNASFE